MKKLSKIKLHDATVLNDNEMKMVVGGDHLAHQGSGCCAFIANVSNARVCFNSTGGVEPSSGVSYIECNTEEVIAACGCERPVN